MPSVIPYNLLGDPKSENGVWTYTGSESSYPLPPSTFDSDLDYTGFSNLTKDYTYSYTVTNGSCSHVSRFTLQLRKTITPYNDNCSGATIINTHNLLTLGETIVENILSSGTNDFCDLSRGLAAASMSVEALPSTWNPAPSTDIWYRIPLPTGNSNPSSITIRFTSANYSLLPLQDCWLAIYTGDCSSLTEQDAVLPDHLQVTTTINYEIPSSNTNSYLYIRMGTTDGGYFDIIINSYGAI